MPSDAALHVPTFARWEAVLQRSVTVAPAAFDGTRLRNLHEGRWQPTGSPSPVVSPVDGTVLVGLPKLDSQVALSAVAAAADAHREWGQVPLAERKARVHAAVEAMSAHRDTLALLLAWEIGKPWALACADVDRALDGVRWYLEEVDGMLTRAVDGSPLPDGRAPLPGPVSNIASWNYPMSVLVHAELVQLLSGNAVITKTPTQGGAVCLSVAHALMHDAGLPVTLVSGDGGELSDALVRSESLGALAFVGGRSNGGAIAAKLVDTGKRHMLEQEGLNAYGVWEFSDWDGLAAQVRKGFEYGKQRCTAYPRFVVQRQLVDAFLAAYLPVVAGLRFGHPLAVTVDGPQSTDALPVLEFGPLITAAKATELRERVQAALTYGAVPLYRGSLAAGRFLDGQDTAAYAAPVTLLAPPGASRLMHEEPFGPVDTIVVVDTEAELLAQMNASNGALVASIACDDEAKAAELAEHVQAFKVGVNKVRSRGDRAEPFGGRGASWKGAFVGGELLVHAVTQGPDGESLFGILPRPPPLPARVGHAGLDNPTAPAPDARHTSDGSPSHPDPRLGRLECVRGRPWWGDRVHVHRLRPGSGSALDAPRRRGTRRSAGRGCSSTLDAATVVCVVHGSTPPPSEPSVVGTIVACGAHGDRPARLQAHPPSSAWVVSSR